MIKLSRAVLCAAALMTTVAACQRAPEAVVSNGQPPQSVVEAGPVLSQGTFRDPSLPDASTVFAAEAAADKARQDAIALQQVATPQKEMTKAEESKEMPLPSQANDLSTTVLDKTRVN